MPVDPELVARLAAETAAVYADAEQRIVATIAARIRARGYEPEWAVAKRDEIRRVRKRAAAILEQARQQAATGPAVQQAAAAGAAAILDQLGSLAADTGQLTGTAAVGVLVREAVTAIQAGQVRVLRDVEDQFREITTRAATGVITGAQTRREASQTALNRLADAGFTAFTDRSGRAWNLASYAEMTTRTIAAHAMVQAQLDTLAAAGHDLVYVSDSPRECPLCAPWEHKVLSISSAQGEITAAHAITGEPVTVTVKGSVADAVLAGLLHPNCTHSLSAYLPGVTRLDPPAHDPESYDAKQHQRYLERGVRRWKRREAAALTPEEARAARRKVRAWQGRIRDHLAEHPELKRLPYRESNPTAAPEPPTVRGPHAADERRGNPQHTDPPAPTPVAVDVPETDPLAGADLQAMSDAEIGDLFGQLGGDPQALDRLAAEMDRRDQVDQQAKAATPESPANPQEFVDQSAAIGDALEWDTTPGESEESRRVDALVDQGWEYEEAVEEVYGVTTAEQAVQQQRGLLGLTGQGGNKAQQVRAAYNDWVHAQYLQADSATRGVMLTREGQAKGVEPLTLFSGPAARARRYASEELKRWWQDNPRVTLAEFREQYLGWESDRGAGRAAREQGSGREFGL